MHHTQVRGLPSREDIGALNLRTRRTATRYARGCRCSILTIPRRGFRHTQGQRFRSVAAYAETRGPHCARNCRGGQAVQCHCRGRACGHAGIKKRMTLIPLNKIRIQALRRGTSLFHAPLPSVLRHLILRRLVRNYKICAGLGTTYALTRRVPGRGRRGDHVRVQRHADLRRLSVCAGGNVHADCWRAQRHARRDRLRAEWDSVW